MGKIIRTFHPVGQGAFYSERHLKDGNNYNIVYDCGNWRNTKNANKVVSQAFDKNDTINVLFISHFDFDHVSMIKTLIESVGSIDNVVIPLLERDDKVLQKAFNHFHTNSSDVEKLIDDPGSFFDKKTHIVHVRKTNNPELPIQYVDPIDLEELGNRDEIHSGTRIRFCGEYDWIFIPYNYDNENRLEQLIETLRSNGIDIEKLNDAEYISAHSKEIKKCYESNKVDGTINENSMLLYSGPIDSQHKHVLTDLFYRTHFFYNSCFRHDKCWHHHLHDCPCDLCDRPACIYSGDSNFKVVQIHNIFRSLWGNVGTVQIPHHGSINSFNSSFGFYKNRKFLCPISHGIKNNYGHPSVKVIGKLLEYGNSPIEITEDTDSTFIEIIRFDNKLSSH